MAKNPTLQYYFTTINPTMIYAAKREKEMNKNDVKLNQLPMTKFLFTYIKKVKKYDEKAKFEFSDWI